MLESSPISQPSEDDAKGFESLVIASGILHIMVTAPPMLPHINSMMVSWFFNPLKVM
jgi:hypothetical protein